MKNSIRAAEVAIFNSAGLSTSYQALNSGGLPGPTVLLRLYNASSKDIIISYDGVKDHDFLSASDTLTLDFQNNAAPNGYVAMLRKGTIVYIKGNSTGTGLISLAAYYLVS